MAEADAPEGGVDPATQAFYDAEAAAYAEYSGARPDQARLDRFAGRLAPGARVLDFGCGSAWAAARFAELGHPVAALDASAGLAEEARRRYGIEVRVARFDAFEERAAYGGIWASFSLLHAPREALPGHLARLARALLPGGVLYVGMKEGTGSKRDALGRLYTYVSAAELRGWAEAAGLSDIEIESEAHRGYAGDLEGFLHLFARRPAEAAPR